MRVQGESSYTLGKGEQKNKEREGAIGGLTAISISPTVFARLRLAHSWASTPPMFPPPTIPILLIMSFAEAARKAIVLVRKSAKRAEPQVLVEGERDRTTRL